ncbi:hypothetical protein CJ030_MR5G010184 [Morella rubra]|uniref:Uncharacterized protein n=1 Tax=Morella rubra TaxID=262757 RepID=A0A6A1VJB2_9ROSI|nr:hypothetical protein CJ030_MR5G010184 [Morella rubra]
MSGAKRARTTRAGDGSSSHEKEPVDSMMTMEKRMEYLRGWPVAKELPMMLSDFDDLLYKEHTLYQLFEYQGFLHLLLWVEGFCIDTLVHDFFCALVSADRAPEVQIKERMDAFQRQYDLEGKAYIEIEVYSEILDKKSGYVRGLGRAVKLRLHQL